MSAPAPSPPREPNSPLLRAQGLTMDFGAVRVLHGVDLELQHGEIHALVGENGAGKSTLSRILAGLLTPTAGLMELNGLPYAPRRKRDAEQRGVRMVLQELNLIRTLSIAENLFLAHLPHTAGWIHRKTLEHLARSALARVNLAGLSPWTPVSALGIGQQQMVEIAAGLAHQCSLLILDEPTAPLTDPEIERLFAQLRDLKSRGTTILYISHRLEEIRRLADRITILRDGRRVGTWPISDLGMEDIVRHMVGRDLDTLPEHRQHTPGRPALRVENLHSGTAVRGVSFTVRQGEIVGMAGLVGSGRTETLRAIFGADVPEAGAIYLHDEPQPARINSPADAVRQGLALLTEDRKEQGLLLPLPIRCNLTLASLPRLARRGWLSPRWEDAPTRQWLAALQVRCQGAEQPVAELSGGNQQKVVLARWLMRDCRILMFDEPTRGIDVGARFEIYQWLQHLAAEGRALLVVSSDLRELMMLCDRILVMSAGRLAGEFVRGQWTEDALMAAALSGYLNKPQPATNHGN
ncbi:MAG: sugar ABC transporter ATP-binding protein [Verrucomicrobiae bacterium]|nr:sugar ABC transporter ATP-binding protein [Verrucomicrobiae bacterium]